MSKSNPIIQRVMMPEGAYPTDKLLVAEEERARIDKELSVWVMELREAGERDGMYGERNVERVFRDLVSKVRSEEVDILVVRALFLRHKGWARRLGSIAAKELNFREWK